MVSKGSARASFRSLSVKAVTPANCTATSPICAAPAGPSTCFGRKSAQEASSTQSAAPVKRTAKETQRRLCEKSMLDGGASCIRPLSLPEAQQIFHPAPDIALDAEIADELHLVRDFKMGADL